MKVSSNRLSPTNAIITAVALLLVAAPASATQPPDVGPYTKLNVDPAHKVAFHTFAEGVQIYRWNGASWVFIAPEAILYADEDGHGVVGIHYEGPKWESNSGSIVAAAVVERQVVDSSAIPWLKLAATSATGPGIFKNITFIQRVNTTGGLAPTEDGDFVGQEARIPYTAEYYFYRAQH
jgi:hypothetical protein